MKFTLLIDKVNNSISLSAFSLLLKLKHLKNFQEEYKKSTSCIYSFKIYKKQKKKNKSKHEQLLQLRNFLVCRKK